MTVIVNTLTTTIQPLGFDFAITPQVSGVVIIGNTSVAIRKTQIGTAITFTAGPIGIVGRWDDATSYVRNNVVYEGGFYYRCLSAIVGAVGDSPATDVVHWIVWSDVSAYNFLWDFGDGAKGVGVSVIHTYTVASPQTRCTLTVIPGSGARQHIGHQVYPYDSSAPTPIPIRGIVVTLPS